MPSPSTPSSDALILTGDGDPRPIRQEHGLLATHARRVGWEWSALLRADQREADELLSRLQSTGLRLHRAARARIQPGLELWQPPTGPRRAIGIVEYVHSEPATREAYYRSQEEVSGPAMRALWTRGLVQRFVGAEVVDDMLPTRAGEPEWDVLHLTEFPLAALPRMLSWTRLFDEHAAAAGHTSMKELKRAWQSQRSMVKTRATIREIAP